MGKIHTREKKTLLAPSWFNLHKVLPNKLYTKNQKTFHDVIREVYSKRIIFLVVRLEFVQLLYRCICKQDAEANYYVVECIKSCIS